MTDCTQCDCVCAGCRDRRLVISTQVSAPVRTVGCFCGAPDLKDREIFGTPEELVQWLALSDPTLRAVLDIADRDNLPQNLAWAVAIRELIARNQRMQKLAEELADSIRDIQRTTITKENNKC